MKLAVWSIKRLCKCINTMMENEFDCVMFIEGKRGLGKSTFGNKIGYYVNSKFYPKNDIAFSREDVIRLLGEKTKGVILADELINVAYNRDFWDQDQKTLIKALNMYRDKCNLFIGCIPSFVDLDKQMQKLCKIRITILRRGYALLQLQAKTLYSNDPWDVTGNRKIEQKFRAGRINYNKFSTVKGIIKFNDLTTNQRELYETIKEDKRGQVFEKFGGEQKDIDPITKLFEKIKHKEISKQSLDIHCQLLGLKIRRVRLKLNDMFKDEGLPGTLKDYVLDETEFITQRLKQGGTKKSKQFELIAKKSKDITDMVLLESNNDNHKTIKYRNQHLWTR